MKKRLITGLSVVALFAVSTVSAIAESTSNSDQPSQNQGFKRNEQGGENRENMEKKIAEKLKSELGIDDAKAKQLMTLLKAQRKEREAFRKKLESILTDEQIEKLKSNIKNRQGQGGEQQERKQGMQQRKQRNRNNQDASNVTEEQD
ncbi:MAG: hypothetical protein WC071_10070 [Victivallaceae bacterium]